MSSYQIARAKLLERLREEEAVKWSDVVEIDGKLYSKPLIQAAPDLLAAAEEALRCLESSGWQSSMADAEARVTLRAAIARVRGEE
jgi:hypothetical protein